jgi:hypothetical protein
MIRRALQSGVSPTPEPALRTNLRHRPGKGPHRPAGSVVVRMPRIGALENAACFSYSPSATRSLQTRMCSSICPVSGDPAPASMPSLIVLLSPRALYRARVFANEFPQFVDRPAGARSRARRRRHVDPLGTHRPPSGSDVGRSSRRFCAESQRTRGVTALIRLPGPGKLGVRYSGCHTKRRPTPTL